MCAFRALFGGKGALQLNRNFTVFSVVFLTLLTLTYTNAIVTARLFNPLTRSPTQMSLLARLVPVAPVDGGVDFLAAILFFTGMDAPPGSKSSVIINSSGLAVGVYGSDPIASGPDRMGSIDWSVEGPILPGQTRKSPVIYLRNEGNEPVSLYLSTARWIFRDSEGNILSGDYKQFFSLDWDYDYSSLAVGDVRPIIFSLTVLPGLKDVSTFSFDLVITLSS